MPALAAMVPEELTDIVWTDCPGGCGTRVLLDVDTDGSGGLIERAYPCRHCRPSRLRVVPAGHQILVCDTGHVWSRPPRGGRPPSLCPECRS